MNINGVNKNFPNAINLSSKQIAAWDIEYLKLGEALAPIAGLAAKEDE